MYKYKNKKTGKIEEVEVVKVQWEAVYKNGQTLKQYDNGNFHRIEEIDQSILDYLTMQNFETGQRIFMKFPNHAKLVHFYLKEISNSGTKDEKRSTAFVFGYEMPTDNHYFVINFSGDLSITNDYNEVDLHTGRFIKK